VSIQAEPWVRDYCRCWGRQKRRIWRGADWHIKLHVAKDANGKTVLDATKHWHIDGYAESFMGHLMEDKMGATQGKRGYQHWPEVMWGHGLEVQRAIVGMPEAATDVLHLHYVFDPEWGLRAERKAALIGMKERAYWDALGRAEYWVFGRLLAGNSAQGQVQENLEKKPQPPLQKVSISAKSRGTPIGLAKVSAPPLDLAALNRSTISLKA
jgi:hypothetical protein